MSSRRSRGVSHTVHPELSILVIQVASFGIEIEPVNMRDRLSVVDHKIAGVAFAIWAPTGTLHCGPRRVTPSKTTDWNRITTELSQPVTSWSGFYGAAFQSTFGERP